MTFAQLNRPLDFWIIIKFINEWLAGLFDIVKIISAKAWPGIFEPAGSEGKKRSKNSPILMSSLALAEASRLSIPGSLIATSTLGLLKFHQASAMTKINAVPPGNMCLGIFKS
jgi:hypothetical protein